MRWLLKKPTDLFSLQEVLNVFPDAKVIQTHRDPVDFGLTLDGMAERFAPYRQRRGYP